MSVHALVWAFGQEACDRCGERLRPGAKAVLVALANWVGSEDGDAWPSVDVVCRMTNYDKATVFRAFKYLEYHGLIVSDERFATSGRQLSTTRRLALERPHSQVALMGSRAPKVPPSQAATPGSQDATGGSQNATPEDGTVRPQGSRSATRSVSDPHTGTVSDPRADARARDANRPDVSLSNLQAEIASVERLRKHATGDAASDLDAQLETLRGRVAAIRLSLPGPDEVPERHHKGATQ